MSSEVKNNIGRFTIKQVCIQCPSLIAASDVYKALLVEAPRPESLPKFTLEYGPENTNPEPRPLPDPIVQRVSPLY